MAYRKEIFAGLRKKHKNTPKVVLDKVADHIETGVNEEDEVEAAVEGADGLVIMISGLVQTEGDKRVEDALKKNGIDPKKPKTGGEVDDDDPNPGETGDKAPAWAKGMLEMNKTLIAKVEALEQGKTVESRLTRLQDILKDVDDKEVFKIKILKDFKRMSFEKDEDFEEFLTETGTDLEAFNQDLSDKGLSSQTAPLMGESNKNGISTNVQAYIDSKAADSKTGGNLGGKEI
ncbi:hypothetical protein [Pedobacter sp. B4-66]|uniref:hypothetical protein n=1 Tax=Pedobacter sp. B4-66 TaxID=2817280 RepID=UPI001BDA0444|nr:hypothetical protein [Pedobacter sp. B4-66]